MDDIFEFHKNYDDMKLTSIKITIAIKRFGCKKLEDMVL